MNDGYMMYVTVLTTKFLARSRYKVWKLSKDDACGSAPLQEIVADKRVSYPQAAAAIQVSLLGHGSTVCPTSLCSRETVTEQFCSGPNLNLASCFKSIQQCPELYPGIPGTPEGIPGRFLVLNTWIVQVLAVLPRSQCSYVNYF